MITLVGTGHVFDLSAAVNRILIEKEPEVVCIELDEQRYKLLLKKKKNDDQYKIDRQNLPILYKLFLRNQENAAKKYGVDPGDEMLAAIKFAQSHQLPIEFIDVNAQETYEKTIGAMSSMEKIKLSLIGILLTFFGWINNYRKQADDEIEKIEKNFDEKLKQLEKNLPTIKRLIIDDRNKYMSKKLIKINDKYKKILAFVGDGHAPGISKILQSNKIEYETIRLKDLNKKVR